MSVTKAVIRDLLPVFVAGEASKDTQDLVEEFLARDPELRALADVATRVGLPTTKPPEGLHSLELRSLNRTRQLLARKSFVLGIALLFTFLPMTVVFQNWHVVLVLARDYPDAASSLLVNAAIAWLVYLDTARRLSATGLELPRSRYSQVLTILVGVALGVPTMLVAQHWAGGNNWPILLPALFAATAFLIDRYWAKMARTD